MATKAARMKDEELTSAFKHIDANKDGRVSYDEFVDWIAAEAEDETVKSVIWSHCASFDDVFRAFTGGKNDMDGKAFSKLCRDTNLVDKRTLTVNDVDLIFAKVVPKGYRRINVDDFKEALVLIAEKKRKSLDDIEAEVLSAKGPVLHGTNAESVRFHDDKSLYTGTHVRGGPEHVAVGTGSGNDQSWKRPETTASVAPADTQHRDPSRASHRDGAPPSRAGHAGAPVRSHHDTANRQQQPQHRQQQQQPAAISSSSGPCGTIARAFERFCAGHDDMDGRSFTKMCKDTGLLCKTFIANDADLIFTKVVTKGQRRINSDQFVSALRLVAERKGIQLEEVEDIIRNASGPQLHGTHAEAVRFHDDKSTYTGVHVNGGPESGAIGAGTACDQSWKRSS
eukprot:TRINITY_DN6668_c0_g1_i2.p1 TRINITY_DN6668_c0_g1~~TRINITY_DN6668_c0_g1_i2.p1  ORF type:complete len:396 (-),score=76.00 TRINITY_DN6668_c0_g1_i2:85-1272(-)